MLDSKERSVATWFSLNYLLWDCIDFFFGNTQNTIWIKSWKQRVFIVPLFSRVTRKHIYRTAMRKSPDHTVLTQKHVVCHIINIPVHTHSLDILSTTPWSVDWCGWRCTCLNVATAWSFNEWKMTLGHLEMLQNHSAATWS